MIKTSIVVLDYIKLVGGFIVLIYSGKYLVKGGVDIAAHFKISKLVVGVTIVSFGTSAPELFVSLKAALEGHPDISIYNVIGSNIANIALVLAITAMIFPIPVNVKSMRFDWPIMMLISIVFYVFVLNGMLDRWEGILFVIALVGYILWSLVKSRRDTKSAEEEHAAPSFGMGMSVLMVVVSCVGLAFSSDWLVDGAVAIARSFDISERVISVSLIALGTSIPELATSSIAAFKKEMDISVGNIIGSNIFNLLAVLGISSIITPIGINEKVLQFDIYFMLGIAFLLFVLIMILKRLHLTRWKGVVLLAVYVVYMYLIFNRP